MNKKGVESFSMVVLGVIAVVAVIGLVLNFVQDKKSAGMLASDVSSVGLRIPDLYSKQSINIEGKKLEWVLPFGVLESCPPSTLCNVPEDYAKELLKTNHWSCYKDPALTAWTCFATAAAPVINIR